MVFPGPWLTLDVRKESLIFREVCDEALDGTSDHSVLSHQDHRVASKRHSDFVHLLGGDIVDADKED